MFHGQLSLGKTHRLEKCYVNMCTCGRETDDIDYKSTMLLFSSSSDAN